MNWVLQYMQIIVRIQYVASAISGNMTIISSNCHSMHTTVMGIGDVCTCICVCTGGGGGGRGGGQIYPIRYRFDWMTDNASAE